MLLHNYIFSDILFIITDIVLICSGCLCSICKQDSGRQNVLLISL